MWQDEAFRMQSAGVDAMAAFSNSISTLSSETEQLSQLCRRMLEVNAADSALERLQTLGGVIAELCQFLDHWLARTEAGEVSENSIKIRRDLVDFHKIGVQFRVVASLTAINASASTTDMQGFIEELRAVPEQIREAVGMLQFRMATVDEAVDAAVVSARAGLGVMEQARDTLAAHERASKATFRQIVQSRHALEEIGNRFLNQSQEQTKALVRGFQYSDFFAQWLDHIARMLAFEAELGPAVRLLAARQLEALAQQGEETVHEILSALQQQSANMGQFTRDFAAQSQMGSQGNAALQSLFAAILTSREQALPGISTAVTSSRLVLAEISQCNHSFEALVGLSGVMDLAAINARVRAAREEKARAAMAFLSGAVMEGARACRDLLRQSSAALTKVAEVQDVAMLDRLVDCVERFGAAFDLCQTELTQSEARGQSRAGTLEAVSALIGHLQVMVKECQQTAQNLTQIVQELRAFGSRLAAGIATPVSWPDMQAIYDSYTIQAERDTHDLLLGRPLSVPAPAKLPELDDIFF